MKLKWIEVAHLGPFAIPTKLNVDPRVTILTGPNDTGKSSLLRAIWLAFTAQAALVQHVNQERLDTFSGKWQDDPEFICTLGLEVTDADIQEKVITGGVQAGDILVMRRQLAQNSGLGQVHVERGTNRVSTSLTLHKPPQVVNLPALNEIRDIIPLAGFNDVEEKLLRLGFGHAFTFQQFSALGRPQRTVRIARAEELLNQRLKQILPKGLPLSFKLNEVGDKPQELNLSIIDPINCFVPVGSRGSGVRRLLTLMGALLGLNEVPHPTIILIDEPENSLHADAQHALRRLLERLAESPKIQVVYATHAASLINCLRPGSIRVLERTIKNGKPTSAINELGFRENFARVRSSLGITPADSLLFASVTVIVEGASEVLSLPLAFERLRDGGIDGFKDVDDILSQIHFLEGGGDQFPYFCRLAKSQNARPIIFLDGDKQRAAAAVHNDHPDVPIVLLPAHEELENAVPVEVYLGAVAKIHELDPTRVTAAAFNDWCTKRQLKQSMMFSKRVEFWLSDEFETNLNKPRAMEEAIRNVPLDQLTVDPFRRLTEAIRNLLQQH